MGWFWADTPANAGPHLRHSMSQSNMSPPPGCPMHNPASKLPGEAPSCPMRASNQPTPPAEHQPSVLSRLNPLNYMFSDLSQSRAPHQTVQLPVERTVSSIPRGDADANWEYPSPQQMYNAMLRKGYIDTPEDAVESMVACHNLLNEYAWDEIIEWERRFSRGLQTGWENCRRGEAPPPPAHKNPFQDEKEGQQEQQPPPPPPKLMRFMGRPKDMTPKAAVIQFLGRVYPAKFGVEPPFDRHDWIILRQGPQGPVEVRYVIDYYSGPPDPTGEEVFYLDVRPALDRPSAACERLMRWGGDVWWRASGGVARESGESSGKKK